MRFYETNFEEYIQSVDRCNYHPEIKAIEHCFPRSIQQFDNLIVYGPPGSGKYSQVLHLLRRYSSTDLKYQTKLKVESEKASYTCSISDIHYEVDMMLLGCNPKIIWHEIYQQILEIVMTSPLKMGIVVCKNFHTIHSELLEIFYSYIQQFNNPYMKVQIKFVLITEHMSFIPTNIRKICAHLHLKRPDPANFDVGLQPPPPQPGGAQPQPGGPTFSAKIANFRRPLCPTIRDVDPDSVLNLKEYRSFDLVPTADALPSDIFNTVCNGIMQEMNRAVDNRAFDFARFRDIVYDILVYNLDATECIYQILIQTILSGRLTPKSVDFLLEKTYVFLKHYNNNYRPIYHLETMLFSIIIELKKNGVREKKKPRKTAAAVHGVSG
jgi:hypothetical protein